jgi:hypothetical protein
LFNSGQSRIVPYGVHFIGILKVAVNKLDTFKPIQDFFTYVESGYVEDNLE